MVPRLPWFFPRPSNFALICCYCNNIGNKGISFGVLDSYVDKNYKFAMYSLHIYELIKMT